MIFDYKTNAKKILETEQYSQGDRFEVKKEYLQEIWLIAYLIDEGKSKDEIRKVWDKIPHIKYFVEEAFDHKELDGYFESLYLKGEETRKRKAFKKDGTRVKYIYQEEIDAINKISRSIDFRKYLFMLLGVYKYYMALQGYCYLNADVRAFAFEAANAPKTYGAYCDVLIKHNQESGLPITSQVIQQFHVSKLSFARYQGKIAFTYSDPNELKNHLDVIEEPKAICKVCGKEFVVNNKTKRDMCEECYAFDLHEREKLRKRILARELRAKKKLINQNQEPLLKEE